MGNASVIPSFAYVGKVQSQKNRLDLRGLDQWWTKGTKSACVSDLRVGNPETFKAGQIDDHVGVWEEVIIGQPNHVGNWVKN